MGKVVTFVAGQLGMIDETEFASMRDAGWWKKADGADADAWADRAGDGGVHRFGCLTRVAASELFFERLDTKEDWRDRLLLVSWAVGRPVTPSGFSSGFSSGFGGLTTISLAPSFPGLSDALSFTTESEPQLMWTGPGAASPAATRPDYGLQLETGLYIYADEDNGDLVVNGTTSLANTMIGLIVFVHASDQLGETAAGAPTAITEPTPSNTDLLTPGELNALQDAALTEQFNGWDVDPDESADPESMPFGSKVRGEAPGIPMSWTVRKRHGQLTDGAGNPVTQAYNRRQRMAGGGLRRAITATVGDAAHVLIDDTVDWRDRIVFAQGRYDSSEIRPGDAGDANYNDANEFSSGAYTYVGKTLGALTDTRHVITLATSLYLLVDASTGALYLRNDTGGTRYAGMMIRATPQLGTRKEQE